MVGRFDWRLGLQWDCRKLLSGLGAADSGSRGGAMGHLRTQSGMTHSKCSTSVRWQYIVQFELIDDGIKESKVSGRASDDHGAFQTGDDRASRRLAVTSLLPVPKLHE